MSDALRGDHSAFASLFERWFRPALAAAEEVIGHRPRATQVVTDAFQLCHDNLAELDDARRFGRWLLEVCRQLAHEEMRSRPGGAVLTGKPELTSLFSSLPDLQEAVARVLTRRGVLVDPAAEPPSRHLIATVVPAAGDAETGAPAGIELPALANSEELASRLHRYDEVSAEPETGAWRRRLRVSAGGGVGLAVITVGSLLWLIGRNDPSLAASRQSQTVQAAQPESAVGIASPQSTSVDPAPVVVVPAPVADGATGVAGASLGGGDQIGPRAPSLKVAGSRGTAAVPGRIGVSVASTAPGTSSTRPPVAPAPTAPPATQPPAPTVPPATQPSATRPPATQPSATRPPATTPTTAPTTVAPTTAKPPATTPTTAAPTTATTKATTTSTAKATTTSTAKATTTTNTKG